MGGCSPARCSRFLVKPSLLPNDGQNDIFVMRVIASNIFDEESGGVDVKLLAYGDVETLVTRSVDRDVADTPSALPGAPLLTPSLSPHGWSNYDHGIC